MDRLGDDFGLSDRGRVERRTAPGNVDRHPRKVHDAPVTAVTAQIVGGSHENAIYRTRFDTQGTKHALRVVNGESCDLETLRTLDAFFANVNAVDRACLGTLVASNTGRQIVAVKAAVSGGYRNRLLRIFELLGERTPVRSIGGHPVTKRDPQTLGHGRHRVKYVEKPVDHFESPSLMKRRIKLVVAL